jgi:hypothetical protein
MSVLTSPLPQIERHDGMFDVMIDPCLIAISKLEVIMSLGYSEGNIDRHFDDRIADLLQEVPQKCHPRAGYRIFDLDTPNAPHQRDALHHEGIYVNGVFFDVNKIVASQLKGSGKIALFIASIGADMEELSKQLFSKGDAVGGHFADIIASAAAERATGLLHDHIELTMAKLGLRVTNRYSPGYCGWQVSEQRKLFSLFPGGCCGVTLNDSSLMLPVKSVSGMIGIGGTVTRAPYLCDRCGQENCTYRAYANARAGRALSI